MGPLKETDPRAFGVVPTGQHYVEVLKNYCHVIININILFKDFCDFYFAV